MLVLLFALLTQPAQARTLVVNPAVAAAADSNPGTDAQPLRTIGAAAALVQPGDVVRIHAGVYREAVTVKQSGTKEKPIRFEAAPGATVVVTGADRITAWRREPGEGNVFSTEWPYPLSRVHPNDAFHLVIGRSEQVFVQGYALRLVPGKDKLTRGTFWIDAGAKRLWAQAADDRDLAGRTGIVEASVRPLIWNCEGAHVHVRGLRFRYASNSAQRGAAVFAGRGDVVEDCVFERTNGIGASFRAEDIVTRRCEFAENGQMGFSAIRAHRLLLSDCVVRGNNVKGYNRGWEAGGNKLVLCRGVVIERSVITGNRGHGIWFDIGNEDNTVRHCRIENNEDGGVFYEISFGLHAHDNVIVGNGLADSPGEWGAQAGINLSSSPGCTIERNLLLGNREGFGFREQKRATRHIDGPAAEEPVWNYDQTIRRNVLAWNASLQTGGWFDQAVPPTGAALDALRLSLTGNLYARQPGQGLYQWGVKWKRHRVYATLEEVQADLKLERDSVETTLPFADPRVGDYRLPAGHPALRLHAMPEGPVPGVRLGAIP